MSRIVAKHLVGVWPTNPWAATFYVDSSHGSASDNNRGEYHKQPLATLNQAVVNAAASDRIIIGSGHNEAIAAAGGCTCNKNDLDIIGMGHGARRPTFTCGTSTAATFLQSGSGVKLRNIRLLCGIDSLVTIASFSGAHCLYQDIEIGSSDASNYQPVNALTLTCTRSIFDNVYGYLPSAGATALITAGAIDECWFQHMQLVAHASTAVFNNTATAARITLVDNYIASLNTTAKPCIIAETDTTGQIALNRCRLYQDAQTGWITPGKTDLHENYGVNDDGETAILIGTPSV